MVPEELEEEEEEEGGQSRLFTILAIALVGLLVLGLLGIGGVFIIRQNVREQTEASQPTPTLMARLPNPSATFTPAAPRVTQTPLPTPTNTPVVAPGSKLVQEAASSKQTEGGAGQQADPTKAPTPTRTPVAGAAPAGSQVVPETGIGGLGAALLAAGLAGVFFAARRLRMSL